MCLSHVEVKCPNCGRTVAPLMMPIGDKIDKVCPVCRKSFNKKPPVSNNKTDRMTKGRWLR
jgi:endogenous inhibitor of DNA gyrase (YacG/DUF329 family)